MAMDDLTREFLIESQEGLDRMERCLTELESKPSDTGLLAEIFRTVHTIKGTVGFLGLKRLEKLAHSGENLLGLLREGKLAAGEQVITGLLQLQDGLRSILKLIENDGNEGQDTDEVLIGRLVELQVPAMAAQGARGRSGQQAGTAVVDAEPIASVPETALMGAAPTSTVEQGKEDKNPDDKNQEKKYDAKQNQDKQEPEGKDKAPDGDASKLKSVAVNTAAESTLRVDVTLLNRMMNLVGELVLTRNQVLQATAVESESDDAVATAGHGDVRSARVGNEGAHAAGVEHLFEDASHCARSVAGAGQASAAADGRPGDRTGQEPARGNQRSVDACCAQLAGPWHLKPRMLRAAAGKDPEGTLKLRAVQEGSHVIIEICDDGAGIAVEKVRAEGSGARADNGRSAPTGSSNGSCCS